MARVHPIFANFTAGELTPLLYGRVDFEKYANGAKQVVNMFLRPHGPAERRAGTHFVAEVKDSTKKTALLPFQFSIEQAYVVEFGAAYMRFYKDGGRIELVVTGAANNGSGLIRITTSVAHGMSTGMRVVIQGVLGTTEANGTWTITNVDATHFDLQGSAFANAWTSGGVVIPDILTVYTEAQLFEVKFIQSADTLYLFHRDQPVYKLVRLSHTDWRMKAVNFLPPGTYEDGLFVAATTLTFGAVTGLGIAITASTAIFMASDVGRMITVGDGRAIMKTVAAGPYPVTTGTVDIVDTLPSVGPNATWNMDGSPATQCTPGVEAPRHTITTLTLVADGWRATDVGRYVRVDKGVIRITKVTSNTVAEGEILAALSKPSAGLAAASGSWSIESAAWTAARGFPGCGGFHEQRLVVGGSKSQPQSFWGSASGDFENFGLGPDDDDSFEFKIAANDVNAIRWIVPTRVLLVGTAATEFKAEGGGNNNAITPTNISVTAETQWGSGTIRPLRVASSVLFITRLGRDFRELTFDWQRDAYVSNNLLLLAEHLTRDFGIVDLAYSRTPHSIIWAVRGDGALLCLTYQRDHNVVAWSRNYTGQDNITTGSPVKGKFEAIASIPHWDGAREVAWFVVNRNINGVQKRYIEYMDDTSGFYGKLYTDCALTYSGAPAQSVSGLSHLNGETVQIVGDGAVYPTAVVAAGAVTLVGPTASKIEVGLSSRALLETLRPEVPVQGTSQGRKKHWAEIIVRLERSLGCFVEGEEVPFRSSQDLMDSPPPIFTGDVKINNTGRDEDATVTVEQRQPLPLTVVAVFGTLGIGE